MGKRPGMEPQEKPGAGRAPGREALFCNPLLVRTQGSTLSVPEVMWSASGASPPVLVMLQLCCLADGGFRDRMAYGLGNPWLLALQHGAIAIPADLDQAFFSCWHNSMARLYNCELALKQWMAEKSLLKLALTCQPILLGERTSNMNARKPTRSLPYQTERDVVVEYAVGRLDCAPVSRPAKLH